MKGDSAVSAPYGGAAFGEGPAALRAMARQRAAALQRPAWKQALAALLLLVFAVQNYVVQTHIHFAPAHAASALAVSQHNPAPANPADDPATCPVCQDLAAAGHYLTPAPLAFGLPGFIAVAAALFAAFPAPATAPAHGWQSRGPPRS